MLLVPAINRRQPQEDIQVSVIWIAWMAETDMGMASPNRLQRASTRMYLAPIERPEYLFTVIALVSRVKVHFGNRYVYSGGLDE